MFGSIFTSHRPLFPHLHTRQCPPHRRRNPLQRRVDTPQGCGAILDRQVNEVDVDGQARKIPHKEIDCRAALQRETRLRVNKRQRLHEQIRLRKEDAVFKVRRPALLPRPAP
ncbi:MAG: hypothetical protein KBA71_01125 [Opitutaceae bacterium]|nr:hypothetical protein [Opitutaceae bacterium]